MHPPVVSEVVPCTMAGGKHVAPHLKHISGLSYESLCEATILSDRNVLSCAHQQNCHAPLCPSRTPMAGTHDSMPSSSIAGGATTHAHLLIERYKAICCVSCLLTRWNTSSSTQPCATLGMPAQVVEVGAATERLRDGCLIALGGVYLLPLVYCLPPAVNVAATATLTLAAACLRTVGKTNEAELLSKKVGSHRLTPAVLLSVDRCTHWASRSHWGSRLHSAGTWVGLCCAHSVLACRLPTQYTEVQTELLHCDCMRWLGDASLFTRANLCTTSSSTVTNTQTPRCYAGSHEVSSDW